MKKSNLATLLSCAILGCISTSSLAQPNFEITIIKYNPLTGTSKNINSDTISLSKDHRSVCWRAYNLSPNTIYHIKETILSPSNNSFTIPDGVVIRNKDQTKNVMVSTDKASNKGVLDQCWSFSEGEDPVGNYSLKVKINQNEFPEFKFKLTK